MTGDIWSVINYIVLVGEFPSGLLVLDDGWGNN